MRGAAMSLKAAVSGLVIFLLSVSVVKGEDTWGVTHSTAQIYAPERPSVSVSPSGEIRKNSEVTLTCISDANPAATFKWYKRNQTPQYLHEGAQLVFGYIQPSDSGEYYCEAENELGSTRSQHVSIKVKYAPTVCSVTVSPAGEIRENRRVTVTCSCDGFPPPEYTWYNEYGHKLSKTSELVFRSVQSSDSGSYYCAAKNDQGERTSGYADVEVKYPPKLLSVSVSPSAEIVEGSSVTLTCRSDANPPPEYTWYKQNSGEHPSKTSELVFSSVQSSDSGRYYCAAKNDQGERRSGYADVEVKYAPKLPSVSVSPSAEIVEGSSVTLTCSSDANPAAKYTWFKKNSYQPLSRGAQLVFSSIKSSDSGEFYCKAENKLGKPAYEWISIDVKYAPKLPSVSVSPSAEIVEGSSVTLTCSSDANPAATYTWFKKNNYRPLSRGAQLVFRSIKSSDSGEFYCKAENELGKPTYKWISIDVRYPPKLPSVSVRPSAEIVEGSSVTLTCRSDANPAAKYTWYKENQKLPKGQELKGGKRYDFPSIRSEDRGIYFCQAENKHGQIKSVQQIVDVQYAPKLPSVSVSPSAEIVEGSSVTLTCSSDANPAANYTWYKKNKDSPTASGQIFTINNTSPDHSGNYVCLAENTRGRHSSTVHLTVISGGWKLATAVTVPAIFLIIILILFIIWIIKKRASKQPSELGERPDDSEQIQPAEEQGELQYATVNFSRDQADPLYSNIQPVKPQRPKKKKKEEEGEQEEMVEYSVVNFNRGGAAQSTSGQEAAAPAALYSTVNKPNKKHGRRNP